MENRAELTAILTKIAYKMPWEEWDLTEAEYDVLE